MIFRLGPVRLGPISSAYVLGCLIVCAILALLERAW